MDTIRPLDCTSLHRPPACRHWQASAADPRGLQSKQEISSQRSRRLCGEYHPQSYLSLPDRKGDDERGSVSWSVVHLDLAPMGGHNLVDDGQTHSQTGFLRRIKGIENVGKRFRINAVSRVLHFHSKMRRSISGSRSRLEQTESHFHSSPDRH